MFRCLLRPAETIKPCSHVTPAFAFASVIVNGFYDNKWWCSHLTLTFSRMGHQRSRKKTQMQTLPRECTLSISFKRWYFPMGHGSWCLASHTKVLYPMVQQTDILDLCVWNSSWTIPLNGQKSVYLSKLLRTISNKIVKLFLKSVFELSLLWIDFLYVGQTFAEKNVHGTWRVPDIQ